MTKRPLFIVGPCALESAEMVDQVAQFLKQLFDDELQDRADLLFKGSFAKDNRISSGSYRGPGLREGLSMLSAVRSNHGLRVTTDIHDIGQVEAVAEAVDVIQIPAFLSRQTSLLEEAGRTGLTVNVKKGQFMAPADMSGAVEKLRGAGCTEVWLTERGSFFGYHDLVVDMRSLTDMRQLSDRVILDITHSLQRPGSLGGSSGGRPGIALNLARAGAAWGLDGIFLEAHPDPSSALCDAACMLPLDRVGMIVRSALAHWEALDG